MAASPILNPSELEAHLKLLRAFYDLKSQIEGGSEPDFNVDANPKKRWESFVRVSVERYVVHESSPHGDTNISPL